MAEFLGKKIQIKNSFKIHSLRKQNENIPPPFFPLPLFPPPILSSLLAQFFGEKNDSLRQNPEFFCF